MVRRLLGARPPAPADVGAGAYAAPVIILEAIAETLPPDHTGVDPDRRTLELEARGETYEAARAALDAQVPGGQRLVWLRSR